MIETIFQAHLRQQFDGPAPHLGGDPRRQKGNEGVFDGGQIAQQIEILEDEADVVSPVPITLSRRKSGQRPLVDDDLPAGGFVEGPDQIEQRAFSAPGRADNKRERPSFDLSGESCRRELRSARADGSWSLRKA